MSFASAASVAPSSPPLILGSVTPRIFTPPLVTGPPGPCGCGCALTPDTSEGFDWVEFARDSLHREPYAWQRFCMIHGGELLPDGRPRFREVWVIVARQNGKSEITVMLCGYWMFIEAVPMILGTSTKLEYAKEPWKKLVTLVNKSNDPGVIRRRPLRRWTREPNAVDAEAWCYADDDCDPDSLSRYKIAPASEEGGRSLTVHKGICDEIRQHRDYSAWGAIKFAMRKVRDAQLWCLSNAGTLRSVVLNKARDKHIKFIRTGVGNPRSAWFEYSAPEGSRADDPVALAMANPEFNRSFDGDELVQEGADALSVGGDQLTTFQTEAMCITVTTLKPAYSETHWTAGHVPGDLSALRNRTVCLFDVSLDGQHATLVAAATDADGRTRVEAIAAWGSAEHPMTVLVTELKEHVIAIKPRKFGWLPGGPAAAYGAELLKRDGNRPPWLPPGVTIEEIRGELPTVCMGLDEQINAGMVLHSDDPLLNSHVLGAERLPWGDRWVISRKGGHCDAAYGVAGAVHLSRTLPVLRSVTLPSPLAG